MTVVAIVGTRTLSDKGRREAELLIKAVPPFLFTGTKDKIISGGALGVDTLVRQLWEELVPFQEYLPKKQTWAYFRERNILIAEECDVLLRVADVTAQSYGSGWTADYAEFQLQKPTYRYLVGG